MLLGCSEYEWSKGGCTKNIQRVHTIANFEVWNKARYDVIFWNGLMDAWIACKEGAVMESFKMIKHLVSKVRDSY